MVIGEGVAVGKTENKREVRVSRAEPPEPLSEPVQSVGRLALCAMAEALEARGALALAAPTAARSSRLASKLYLPSALVEMQLPSGLGDLTTVPRLQRHDEEHDAQAMLDEYVLAIRATVRVFATYQHKKQTLVAYDGYMLWIIGRVIVCRAGCSLPAGRLLCYNQSIFLLPSCYSVTRTQIGESLQRLENEKALNEIVSHSLY